MAARARWRGTTTAQRGYSGQHPKLRAQWKPLVQAGQVFCHAAICLMPSRWIPPDKPGQRTGWHLGHTPDRTGWTGPEHEKCNEADGARRRNAMYGGGAPTVWRTSRRW